MPLSALARLPRSRPWGAHRSVAKRTLWPARLKQIDLTLRTGHERSEPKRGDDETVHAEWADPAQIASIDPVDLRDILRDDGVYLAQEAAGLV